MWGKWVCGGWSRVEGYSDVNPSLKLDSKPHLFEFEVNILTRLPDTLVSTQDTLLFSTVLFFLICFCNLNFGKVVLSKTLLNLISILNQQSKRQRLNLSVSLNFLFNNVFLILHPRSNIPYFSSMRSHL